MLNLFEQQLHVFHPRSDMDANFKKNRNLFYYNQFVNNYLLKSLNLLLNVERAMLA